MPFYDNMYRTKKTKWSLNIIVHWKIEEKRDCFKYMVPWLRARNFLARFFTNKKLEVSEKKIAALS